MFDTSSGPSEEEIRSENLDRAKKREQSVRALALDLKERGVVQLFGPGNPALNIPGASDA